MKVGEDFSIRRLEMTSCGYSSSGAWRDDGGEMDFGRLGHEVARPDVWAIAPDNGRAGCDRVCSDVLVWAGMCRWNTGRATDTP